MLIKSTVNLTYLYQDHLGSAAVAVDASTNRAQYLPYGSRRDSADLGTSYTYTGQQALDGLDVLNYGARWYDPITGRFLQADTIVPQPGNPQSLNRYAYCLNNPLKYTDPTGHAYEAGNGEGGVGTPTPDDLSDLMDTFEVSGGLMCGGTPTLAQLRAAQNLVGAFRYMGYDAALDWYMSIETTGRERDLLAGALLLHFTHASCGSAVFDIRLQIQNSRPIGQSTGAYFHDGDPANGIGPRTFRLSKYLTHGKFIGTSDLYSLDPRYLEDLVKTTSHEPSHMEDWLSMESSLQIAGSVANMSPEDASLWESLHVYNNEDYNAYRSLSTEEKAFAREDACWAAFFHR